tara:strand:+ start:1677 stop:2108 length:432 start_codon:yes stop_codon:yes gene_type:complete
MGLFDGIVGSVVNSVVGSVASRAGAELGEAIFGDDKKSTAASTGPTVAPGTPYSQVDPLKGLEEPKPPPGVGGFMGNVTVKPSRSREEYNPYLTEGVNGLLKSVMSDPPASPKMVQEIAMASAASNITSSGSSRKALQKLFKT